MGTLLGGKQLLSMLNIFGSGNTRQAQGTEQDCGKEKFLVHSRSLMATETQESRPGKNPWNQCWNQHVDPRGHLIILKGLGSCQRVNPGDRRGGGEFPPARDAIGLTEWVRVQSHC